LLSGDRNTRTVSSLGPRCSGRLAAEADPDSFCGP